MLSLEPSRLGCALDDADSGPRVVHLAAAVDGEKVLSPAAMLIEDGRIRAVDRPARIGEAGRAPVDLKSTLALPGLVNAHVHLDLTSVGPIPLTNGFDSWLAAVRDGRPQDPEAVDLSVRLGVDRSLRGGVVAVGDIAGAFGVDAARALAGTGLAGISFVELFGIGNRLATGLEGLERLRSSEALGGLQRPGFQVGVSPHAPYSCDRALYESAAATGLPVSTHLAETPEEAEFTRHGSGPMLELLQRLGAVGTSEPEVDLGRTASVAGPHPIDGLLALRPRRPWVLAHLNYPTEPDESEPGLFERRAEGLRRLGATVVFCPRAARFLGHPRPGREPHPWRRLLAAGVPVALGTDGLPCLETGTRLSPLDDARLLWSAGAAVIEVVRMMTVTGARALGLNDAEFCWSGSGAAGVIGLPVEAWVDPADEVELARGLGAGSEDPRWLLAPRPAELAV